MTDTFNYSLFAILLLTVLSLVVRLQQPFAWGGWMSGQTLVTLVVVLGGTLAKQPLIGQGLGWFLFCIFHLPAWYLFRQSRRAMTAMDTAGILKYSKLFPYVFWGPPGRFWRDIGLAYVYYASDRKAEADALLDYWQTYPGLPGQLKDTPIQYRLYGHSLIWDWQGVIREFEKLRFGARKVSASLYFAASRAYIEMGDFDKSAECLKQAKFEESINPLDSVALSLVPFFALCGARGPLTKLLNLISETNKELPYALLLCWYGRCLGRQGEVGQARETLMQALDLTDVPLLRKRIEEALHSLDKNLEDGRLAELVSATPELTKQVDEIWALFTRGAFIQELLSPRRSSPLVNALLAANVLVFIFANGTFHPFGKQLAFQIFKFGALTGDTFAGGEYWRLITYLFLHTTIFHIAVNLLGLQFFGRIAENIFGSVRFIAIYFVGGILSGAFHLLLTPWLIAVGASGAILAIFGAVAAGIYKLKTVLPSGLRQRYLCFMAALAISQVFLDQFDKHIAGFAHLGGLLSGFALGMVTAIRKPSAKRVDGTQKFIEG